MHIGKRVQELMKLRGVGTKAMAVHCGCTMGAVSNWFSTGRISKENLSKAAQKLRTTSDRLVNYDVTDIMELEERDKRQTESGRQFADRVGAAEAELRRRTYSPEALEVAWVYDNLPDELSKFKAQAYLANLETRNPHVAATPAPRPASPPAAAKRRPPSAPPSAKRRRQSKT